MGRPSVYDPGCAVCGQPRVAHDPVTGRCPPPPSSRNRFGWALLDGLDMVGKSVIIGIVLFVVLVVAGYFIWHAWFVDTHCTTVLGSQVCK